MQLIKKHFTKMKKSLACCLTSRIQVYISMFMYIFSFFDIPIQQDSKSGICKTVPSLMVMPKSQI